MTGTSFAVWAPNARGVRVSGDWNFWDGSGHPMRSLGLLRGLGALRPRDRRRRPLQVPGARRRQRVAREGRPDGPAHRGAAGYRERRHRVANTLGRRRPGSSKRAQTAWHEAPVSVYEVHLGSWRAGLELRELADRAGGLRPRARLHPRRAPAGRRASVRRLVGLSGHVLLRAHRALRHPRRVPPPRRRAAPGRHRRAPGLGARAFPEGRLGARPVRRHPAVRAPGSAARRAARLGHVRLRLRSPRGAQFPRRQRALLVRRIPHRRAAGRRRRLDAVSGLLASRRRLGRRTSSVAGKICRPWPSCRRPTPPSTANSPAR